MGCAECGTSINNGGKVLAARPVGVIDLGALKVKLGGEYKQGTDQNEDAKGEITRRGVGAGVQYVFGRVFEVGASGAYGMVDRYAQDGSYDEKGSNTTWSTGVFGNVDYWVNENGTILRYARRARLGNGNDHSWIRDVVRIHRPR